MFSSGNMTGKKNSAPAMRPVDRQACPSLVNKFEAVYYTDICRNAQLDLMSRNRQSTVRYSSHPKNTSTIKTVMSSSISKIAPIRQQFPPNLRPIPGDQFCTLTSLFNKNKVIHLVGLKNVGLQSILYKLQVGEKSLIIPTVGFGVSQVAFRGVNIEIYHVGGRNRPNITSYCDALIFVVDSADKNGIGISKHELVSILQEEKLRKAVLVVLANKQDLIGALSVAEIHQQLGLDVLENVTYNIFKTSAVKGEGLKQAMEWLCKKLLTRK